MILGTTFLFVYKSLWAAPIQVLSAQILTTAFVYAVKPWRPRFCWNAGLRGELFGFSGLVFLNNLLVTLSKNAGQIVLGRTLGPAELGLYSLAFTLTDTVRTSLMSIMNRVMFVHYAENQEDPSRLSSDYLRTLAWNCSIVFPLMLTLGIVGPDLVPMLLGDNWKGMDPVLPILAAVVMVHVAGGSTSSLLTAIGRPGLDLRLFALTTIGIMFPAIIAGGWWFGSVGVAGGLLLSKIASVMIRQVYMKQLIGLKWSSYASVLTREAIKVLPLVGVLACLAVFVSSLGPLIYGMLAGVALLPYGLLFARQFARH